MKTAYQDLNIHQRINLKHNFDFGLIVRTRDHIIRRSYGALQYMLRTNLTYHVRNITHPVSNETHETLKIHRNFYNKLTH